MKEEDDEDMQLKVCFIVLHPINDNLSHQSFKLGHCDKEKTGAMKEEDIENMQLVKLKVLLKLADLQENIAQLKQIRLHTGKQGQRRKNWRDERRG